MNNYAIQKIAEELISDYNIPQKEAQQIAETAAKNIEACMSGEECDPEASQIIEELGVKIPPKQQQSTGIVSAIKNFFKKPLPTQPRKYMAYLVLSKS